MTRNSGRMPSSRKRKRPSGPGGPQERCQRSASSQSSSDDNRSGGRGCGRVIATFATTSKEHISKLPQAAIAIASHMASDLRPEHKLPSKDVLVTPTQEFMKILETVGAEKNIFTAREVLSFLIKYISSRQLYDPKDPKTVFCKNDPLGKVFNVDMFTIKEAKKLLFDNMTVVQKGTTLPGLTGEDDRKNYFTLSQRRFNEEQFPNIVLSSKQSGGLDQLNATPPSTITEPMDSADGNGVKPVSKRNPLVPIGLDYPTSAPPALHTFIAPTIVEEPMPVTAPSLAPNPLSSSTSIPVVMDTAEDVTKATANVANLFRSVSLDVDPCQEGPSTASATALETPEQSKPAGKRTTKTRQPSDSSDYSKANKSDDASETEQWVRVHYRPGEETKSLSSERLSVQDYETVVVADSSDDLWFVEQEVSEFEIEYSVGDSSEGFASNGSADDSSSETEMVFELDGSSDSRFADDSSSTDTEISDQDKWDCFECQNRNPPVDRYCNRCWALRKGWLPDEQRMTLRERLINQAKELRRTNSAPAGHIASSSRHSQLTKGNLERHNQTCHEEKMDTLEAIEAAPIIRPGRTEVNNNSYPSIQCATAAGGGVATLPPLQFCDSGHLMTLGNTVGQYTSNLEVIPDQHEDIGDFIDGNEDDKEQPVGRQVKTGEESGNGAAGGGQGGAPNSQNQKTFGGTGFAGGFSTGQGGLINGSPRHAFGEATFGQANFGQTTFGHKSVVNNSPPSDAGPRVFGEDLEGYSPSAGPKPGGGILHQGHFKSSLSVGSEDSHHATCSANTLSPESELDDEKTARFNLIENDPIARKRMKMDTQRQDSGIGLSQEMSERSKASPDAQMCNDNYVQLHGDPPPPMRRRHSSASELESGLMGGQDSTIQSSRGGNFPGAIESNAFDSAEPTTSQEGQTKVPDICGFCFKRPKNASIIHGKTGHQVCCYQCAKKLRRRGKPCPICRQSIQAVIKNFLV